MTSFLDSHSHESFFESSGICEHSTLAKAMAGLRPAERVLMSYDGTVTKVLESWFWERVNVVVESQQERALQTSNAVDPVRVLYRSVSLRGEESKKTFCHAESIIFPERLDGDLYEALLAGELGIGQLLRRFVLETYRQIIGIQIGGTRVGRDCASPPFQALPPSAIARLYQVLWKEQPAMMIREHFTLD